MSCTLKLCASYSTEVKTKTKTAKLRTQEKALKKKKSKEWLPPALPGMPVEDRDARALLFTEQSTLWLMMNPRIDMDIDKRIRAQNEIVPKKKALMYGQTIDRICLAQKESQLSNESL